MFVMHCLKCAACIGFHIMTEAESPRTLFEIVYTRWKVPPKVVVYDNSCHGHQYFLNREPAYASSISFHIDKLHFKGHTGCCRAYDIGLYPTLANLNSQMAEQKVGPVSMHTCMHMHTRAHACMHVCMHAHTHTHICTRTFACAYVCVCACVHTPAHIHAMCM